MVSVSLTKEEIKWLLSTLAVLESSGDLDEYGKYVDNEFSLMEDKIKENLLKKLRRL